MWLYCWPAAAYHLVRLFPKGKRIPIRILLLTLTLLFLAPQFYVLSVPTTQRYCGEKLLEMLVLTTALTFFMIGFTVLLAVLDPVPKELKICFHVFGIISFFASLVYAVLALHSNDCRNNTNELYWYSYAIGIISILAIVYFIVLLPFWFLDWRHPGTCLDRRNKTGPCYEAVRCCPCLWHI